jgi:hypothetical protein
MAGPICRPTSATTPARLAIHRRHVRDIEVPDRQRTGEVHRTNAPRCISLQQREIHSPSWQRLPLRARALRATARADGPIVSNLAKELVQTSGITFPSKSLSCHQSLNEALNIETTGLQRTGNCLKEILRNIFEAPLNIQGMFSASHEKY